MFSIRPGKVNSGCDLESHPESPADRLGFPFQLSVARQSIGVGKAYSVCEHSEQKTSSALTYQYVDARIQ